MGFDIISAFNAERLNESISEGRTTFRSVIEPSLCTLNWMITRPRMASAELGTIQLRLTWAMKRRIHGPNSTPLVSNWMAGPNSFTPPFGLLKASCSTYF